MRALTVFAHPDDETIFLGGFITKHRWWEWTFISITHTIGSPRGMEFCSAAAEYGAEGIMLGFEDCLEKHLDREKLRSELKGVLDARPRYDFVITHNGNGEYGHPHHVDTGVVVRELMPQSYVLGYNVQPDLSVVLTPQERRRKVELFRRCYPSQADKWQLRLLEFYVEGLVVAGAPGRSCKNGEWDELEW